MRLLFFAISFAIEKSMIVENKINNANQGFQAM